MKSTIQILRSKKRAIINTSTIYNTSKDSIKINNLSTSLIGDLNVEDSSSLLNKEDTMEKKKHITIRSSSTTSTSTTTTTTTIIIIIQLMSNVGPQGYVDYFYIWEKP